MNGCGGTFFVVGMLAVWVLFVLWFFIEATGGF